MKYPLSELIDVTGLQQLMESLYRATGIKHALLDNASQLLTGAGWEPVCLDFHRKNPHTCAQCLKSDRQILSHTSEVPYLGYTCGNGMADYAIPVKVGGEHVATIMTGQVFHEVPDLDFFQRQARRVGFDEQPYLAAVRQVPVVPRERMEDIMAFLTGLAQMVGQHALTHLREKEARDELRKLNEDLMRHVRERTEQVSAANLLLSEKILMQQQVEAALRQEKQFADDLVSSLPGIFYVLDGQGRFARWNSKLCEVSAYSSTELESMVAAEVFPPEAHESLAERIHKVFETGEAELEAPILTKDGRQILHSFTGRRTIIDDKPYLVGLGVDISERHAAETLRREGENKLRVLFELSPLGIVLTDMEGHHLESNEAFRKIFDLSIDESMQTSYWELITQAGEAEDHPLVETLMRTGRYGPFEKNYRHADGKLIPLRLNGMLFTGFDGRQYVWSIVEDITLLKQHENELKRMAHYDALTGIPNRTLLADRMNQALAQARRNGSMLAVCYLDLDGFKAINDRFGHDMGDQLLVEIAARIKACLRGGDTVARIGGDEFVLLLGLDQMTECSAALGRLLSAVKLPLTLAGQSETISASLGATIYPVDDVDGDALIRHADQAMYLAKQAGKNRYQLFDPEQDKRTRAQLEHVARVSEALQNEEFVLYYQPKVNMRLGTVIGVEALLRWKHPVRGLLAPAEFLPAVEATEEIIAIGDWVIARALHQLLVWTRAGLDLSVSVNIAARHLLCDDFVPRLREHLAAYSEVPHGKLELEVLETAALEDLEQVASVIHACRELGVSFSLDDFGTGYSSLTYLKQLPVETLKIDQTFVRGMLDDPEDIAIVKGIISLSAVFRRSVVAEGVETLKHGALLLELGCELGQGFGIAQPMPASELPMWVDAWKPDPQWQK